jgi:hypothetical protein
MANKMTEAKLYSAWVNLKHHHPTQISDSFKQFYKMIKDEISRGTTVVLPVITPKKMAEVTITPSVDGCDVHSHSRVYALDELNYHIKIRSSVEGEPQKSLYTFESAESIELKRYGINLSINGQLHSILMVNWPKQVVGWMEHISLVQKPFEILSILQSYEGKAKLYLMVGATQIYGLIRPPSATSIIDPEVFDNNFEGVGI